MSDSVASELITVLGGGGYIGSLLIRYLLSEGFKVRVFDDFQYGRDGVQSLVSDRLEIIEGDLCDIRSLSRAISGADTVILLAAIVGRRITDIDQPYMREVNLLASSVALDAALEHGVRRFIFASTDSIYGVQSGVIYETSMPDPVSLYSRLKLRMEEQIIKAKKRSFHPTALRIATCYGVAPRMRFDLVGNSLIRDAVSKGEMILKSGEQCRALIHVDDVARVIMHCVKAHVNLVSGEVFNVCSTEKGVSLHQLANLVENLVPDVTVVIEDDAPDLVDYHLSSSKAAKILDFTARWNLHTGLEQVRDAIKSGVYKDPYDPKYSNT
jgi:nucleoside-diphosphate-sugar epimerase